MRAPKIELDDQHPVTVTMTLLEWKCLMQSAAIWSQPERDQAKDAFREWLYQIVGRGIESTRQAAISQQSASTPQATHPVHSSPGPERRESSSEQPGPGWCEPMRRPCADRSPGFPPVDD